jgi:hypothetical protein
VYSPDLASWELLYERHGESTFSSYRDASLSGLTATISGGGLTVTVATSVFGAFTPAANDVLVGGTSGRARITNVVTGGGNYTITVDAVLTGTTVTWHQAISATVQWQAQYMPGRCSRWFEWHFHFTQSGSAYVTTWPLVAQGSTSEGATGASVTANVADIGFAASRVVRIGPHRSLVRTTELYPEIVCATAGVLWQLAELDLHAVAPQSQRVAR